MQRFIGVSVLWVLALSLSSANLPAETPEQKKVVARRVFDEIFNQGRFEVADEIYAQDFVNHGLTCDIGLKEDQDAARGWKRGQGR